MFWCVSISYEPRHEEAGFLHVCVSSRRGSYVHRRVNVMYIYIYMLLNVIFSFSLSNRCVSHFLVALVFRFDKVYIKIIGDAFYVSSFSFCLYVLCSNALTRPSEIHTKEGGFKKNTFHYCYT